MRRFARVSVDEPSNEISNGNSPNSISPIFTIVQKYNLMLLTQQLILVFVI